MKMNLVVLESPYAGLVERNVAYARAAARDCLMRGESPFPSHLLFTQAGVLRDEDPAERALGINAGLAWAEKALYAVVYQDLGITSGMLLGIAAHRARNLPIEYRNLPEWSSVATCADCAGPVLQRDTAQQQCSRCPKLLCGACHIEAREEGRTVCRECCVAARDWHGAVMAQITKCGSCSRPVVDGDLMLHRREYSCSAPGQIGRVDTSREVVLLKVEIEGAEIVIRMPFDTLKVAADNAPELEGEVKVTDPAAFASDVLIELQREEEDGTTLVHRALVPPPPTKREHLVFSALYAAQESFEEHQELYRKFGDEFFQSAVPSA